MSYHTAIATTAQPGRKVVSKTGMSVAELSVHWTLIVFTCGMWYPVYRARKHAADRTTITEII